MSMLRWFLQLSVLVKVAETAAVDFTPGAICNSAVNGTASTKDVLRGKHLIVYNTPWDPFAILDANAPYGWRGFDVDLLEMIAGELGFTFTIREFGLQGEETWTDSLFRVSDEADLVMSYWTRTQLRMERVVQIAGHIDMSSVLAARLDTAPPTPIWDKMRSFFRPYSGELWGCLALMVICSGVIDYLLEKDSGPGSKIGGSIYEYIAGTLWGGCARKWLEHEGSVCRVHVVV